MMFCCELFVGVIISEFVEIHSIKSPRLFNALEPIFEFGPTEREAVLAGLLQLNRSMKPYNRTYFALLVDTPAATKHVQMPAAQSAAPQHDAHDAAHSFCSPCHPSELHKSTSDFFAAALRELMVGTEALDQTEQSCVHNEYQVARLNKEYAGGEHISPCIPALLLTLSQEMVAITEASDPSDWEEMRRQHREAVTQWLVGFTAAMCSEGIIDHFNFVEFDHSAPRKAKVFAHFEYFGSQPGGGAEWSKMVDACHVGVDKIFDSHHGDPWLEPSDARTASMCIKQICSLLALEELVNLGEVFYQQATEDWPTEPTEEWHRPFVWGMRMFQVMKTVSSSTFSEPAAPILTYAQFAFENPLCNASEIELIEMKTDTTHALSSNVLELSDVIEAEALEDSLKHDVVAGLFHLQDGREVVQEQEEETDHEEIVRELFEVHTEPEAV